MPETTRPGHEVSARLGENVKSKSWPKIGTTPASEYLGWGLGVFRGLTDPPLGTHEPEELSCGVFRGLTDPPLETHEPEELSMADTCDCRKLRQEDGESEATQARVSHSTPCTAHAGLRT